MLSDSRTLSAVSTGYSEDTDSHAGSPLLRLRPHHFLCIQNYRGHGYSPAFDEKMKSVIASLRRPSGEAMTCAQPVPIAGTESVILQLRNVSTPWCLRMQGLRKEIRLCGSCLAGRILLPRMMNLTTRFVQILMVFPLCAGRFWMRAVPAAPGETSVRRSTLRVCEL